MNFGEKKEMAKKRGFFIYFLVKMLEICQNRINSSREGWSTAQRLYSRQEVDKRHREKKLVQTHAKAHGQAVRTR